MQMAALLGMDTLNEKLFANTENFEPAVDYDSSVVDDRKGWLQYVAERMALQNHWLLLAQWKLQQLQWQWSVITAMGTQHSQLISQPKAHEDAHTEAKVIL